MELYTEQAFFKRAFNTDLQGKVLVSSDTKQKHTLNMSARSRRGPSDVVLLGNIVVDARLEENGKARTCTPKRTPFSTTCVYAPLSNLPAHANALPKKI